MCECSNLPDAISIPYPDQSTVTRWLLVNESIENWAALYRCRECAQLWKVDVVSHDRVAPVAVKLPGEAGWATFNDAEARRALLVREHGGLSEATCSWAGCNERALRGKRVCAFHAQPR
jgi:hypothetical protein